jgi:hypothetical protein
MLVASCEWRGKHTFLGARKKSCGKFVRYPKTCAHTINKSDYERKQCKTEANTLSIESTPKFEEDLNTVFQSVRIYDVLQACSCRLVAARSEPLFRHRSSVYTSMSSASSSVAASRSFTIFLPIATRDMPMVNNRLYFATEIAGVTIGVASSAGVSGITHAA